MNCKPGDLAVKVRSYDSHAIPAGAIVEVLRAASWPGIWLVRYRGQEIDPTDGAHWGCQDALLRPIRGQPGDDETLTWAGKPAALEQPA